MDAYAISARWHCLVRFEVELKALAKRFAAETDIVFSRNLNGKLLFLCLSKRLLTISYWLAQTVCLIVWRYCPFAFSYFILFFSWDGLCSALASFFLFFSGSPFFFFAIDEGWHLNVDWDRGLGFIHKEASLLKENWARILSITNYRALVYAN